jgi:3-phosphoshikimate 1-carboxyvinyltransferase
METTIRPQQFNGTVRIPASKSHTIRRLLVASMAEGLSEIRYPLDSLDARSCAAVCRAMGATIKERRGIDPACPNPPGETGEKLLDWTVRGKLEFLNEKNSFVPQPCNVGNSGTTLFLSLALAALGSVPVHFDGDKQIRRRSAAPLLEALKGLGVRIESAGGCAPITVQGPWKGGRISLPSPTSQYLSALLLAAPCAPKGIVTEIDVPLLNERPYIEMTLSYLEGQQIPCEHDNNFSFFRIPGGSSWKPMTGTVPGDFSSAAFPALAAAVSGGNALLLDLDPADTQGDKAFLDILSLMGCEVHWEEHGGNPAVRIGGGKQLRGGEFDLNKTPDLLPAAAALAAFAEGDTLLYNAAHARIKETDRIVVMREELSKLGVQCEERPDGLVIHGEGRMKGGEIDSRGDHRIALVFAAAACGAASPITIHGSECAAVTYPGFIGTVSTTPIESVRNAGA